MEPKLPRYEQVRARALRRRAAAISALTLVPGMALGACSTGDAALEAAQADVTSTVVTTTSIAGTTVTESTTSTTTAPTTTASTTTVASETTTTISEGSELAIDFTYEASSSGGRVHNPYIAVWIEDADGELVQTLSVWYLQSSKGTKWLSDLRRWVSVDGSSETLDAVSGATRTPGDYSLAWDGTNLDGDLVEEGTYYICIEAAREHGPYSLVREAVDLGSNGFAASLTADAELTGVEVTFDVA